MTPSEAASYHAAQIAALAGGGVDQVSAITLTYPAEAIGFVRAAQEDGIPSVASFTVETDGRLPNGAALRDAIEEVDGRPTARPVGFMVNCAHPTHLAKTLSRRRLARTHRGLRANASTLSHAELDAAEDLDDGDPDDLADRYRRLRGTLPPLDVLGGCCGTDDRHVDAIANACLAP